MVACSSIVSLVSVTVFLGVLALARLVVKGVTAHK